MIKFTAYNQQRKENNQRAAQAISQLNAAIDVAIQQQAYFRKDPNGLFTNADDRQIISAGVANLVPSWEGVKTKVDDMLRVMDDNDPFTVDDLIAKYSVDLDDFASKLV